MLLHLEQPYAAILVCTGDTHDEPVILGFPESKKKDALTATQIETALVAIAVEEGWDPGMGFCDRCAVEWHKLTLGTAKLAFDDSESEEELQRLTTEIEEHEAYLARFDPDRKKQQQELPLDEAEAPVAGEDAEASTETPPDE